MEYNLGQAFRKNFLGGSPVWYKLTIIGFLIMNPILLAAIGPEHGPFIVGWILILEFIFTLAISILFFRERTSPGELLGMMLVVAGIVYLLMVA